MWWTRHQGRSRWSRSGRERWRGWGTHRRRTGMRRSCDFAWHRLSNFENLVGNTVDNHSEGNALCFFFNPRIILESLSEIIALDKIVKKKTEHFYWILKQTCFLWRSWQALFFYLSVFLRQQLGHSTLKNLRSSVKKEKNISRKGSTFRCNVSHLNFKQIGGEETNCLKQAFWAFLPPTSSRGTCRFSHYLFINININF